MIGAGGIFVLVCMWMYTGSLFVTIMTVFAITFSLGISYFMYTLVFELRFFPFMNLLASIVAVGKSLLYAVQFMVVYVRVVVWAVIYSSCVCIQLQVKPNLLFIIEYLQHYNNST
jgi:hypothetical protein